MSIQMLSKIFIFLFNSKKITLQQKELLKKFLKEILIILEIKIKKEDFNISQYIFLFFSKLFEINEEVISIFEKIIELDDKSDEKKKEIKFKSGFLKNTNIVFELILFFFFF
jgi:hypothetical protein